MICVHLKPELQSVLCVCVCVCVCVCLYVRARESSQTRAPNALSALANKACKLHVSCLTV